MIRKAISADADELLFVSHVGTKESPLYSRFTIDPIHMKTTITRNINDENTGFFVATEKDKIIGFIMVALTPFYGNYTEKLAIEGHWFVLPEYRSSRHGLELLEHGEHWAFDQGAKALIASKPAEMPVISEVYKRRNYQEYETMFVKWGDTNGS